MRKFAKKIALVLSGCLFLYLCWAQPVLADSRIVLDGHFGDWQGQVGVTDPTGDSHSSAADLVGFYWANNQNDQTCYWMIQRVPSQNNVSYIVYLDTNNNGRFTDRVDRAIIVQYRPKKQSSLVSIEVREADNWRLIDRISNKNWGESLNDGAAKVEFGVSFKDLGIGVGQTVRMYAESFGPGNSGQNSSDQNGSGPTPPGLNSTGQGNPGGRSEVTADLNDNHRLPHPDDRIPDRGDVQWSPMPILSYPILAVAVVGGVIGIWYFKGRHVWRSR